MSELFRDLDGDLLCPNGSVVCIGAFDGLHVGHRALLHHTIARAREQNFSAVALSFEPLPREFFSTGVSPGRLSLPRAKFEGLRELGMDVVGMLRFDKTLTAMTPQVFIERILQKRLSAREVWVGPEFRFGHARKGDIGSLQAAGIRANSVAPVLVGEERVSSSSIREALSLGNFQSAARLLGRPYAIAGRVVRGQRLGRTLGYPTANLRFGRKQSVLSGIYATWVHGIAAQPWPAVSSFGTRPTVGGVEPLLEAHLFDFDGDLYGRRLTVEFVAKLRDEVKFSGLPELIAQMDDDASRARLILQPPSALSEDSGSTMQAQRRAPA